MLTENHKQLIRSTLTGRTPDSRINAEQRSAIHQLCIEVLPVAEPERFLRAFVDTLVQGADAEGIAYGVERDAMLSQIVSVFVDEIHATNDGETLELGLRRETPATAPRLFLDGDSASASL
ncbi:MAG TPA: hypothetical protein VJ865_09740 [Gemmatimonadaceae bacterium]|nr:hypothetical protein [Gemmatimonadaceae bacterium]